MSRLVASGTELESAAGRSRIPRHHHIEGYAALVLRGGYLEAGDRGRFRAGAGDVLFHLPFEGHCDWVACEGAEILNLPLERLPDFPLGRCKSPDEVARIAERDRLAAVQCLFSTTSRCMTSAIDWPDMLADSIRLDPSLRLERWADSHGIAPATLSRGFRLAYGVTPKRYRVEQRAAVAARAIRDGAPLCEAAFACGFADQPHMTRVIADLFRCSPARLRN